MTLRVDTGSTVTNYKYTDQELDPETGLVYAIQGERGQVLNYQYCRDRDRSCHVRCV